MRRDPGVTREEDRIIRAHLRHEEAATGRLRVLLRRARQNLKDQIQPLPRDTVRREVLGQMLSAVQRSIDDLNGQMTTTFNTDVIYSVELGGQLTDVPLPSTFTRVGFQLAPTLLDQVSIYEASLIRDLTDDLRADIQNQLQLGLLGGEDTKAIARRIGLSGLRPIGPFKTAYSRAETIVRTELNRMMNFAGQQRLEQAGGDIPNLRKRWLATSDPRTRPSHRAANGQVVAFNADYTVGGYKAKHPVDPRLPAFESIKCRCRSVAVVPE